MSITSDDSLFANGELRRAFEHFVHGLIVTVKRVTELAVSQHDQSRKHVNIASGIELPYIVLNHYNYVHNVRLHHCTTVDYAATLIVI